MKARWSLVVFLAYTTLVHCQLEVQLKKGKIKGETRTSRDGRNYYSYTGIPYAKPPVGERRFKAPEAVESWNGTLDATKEPKVCVQQGSKNGDEDCLYLNVYVPVTPEKSLPVMFWIHGGGFTSGTSRSDVYGADYLMDKDIILVTINYRLGIMGFLSTEDDVIPGNYGMKDQVEALRWVQANIKEFNGDPNRVTIAGGSAGASCVGYHMLSPASKGLFHKAILQSGTSVCRFAASPPGISRKRAYAVATIAECRTDTSEQLLDCLRKLPALYLMDIHTKMFSWNNQPGILFNPVVESCNSSHEPFLCHHPIYDFKQESFVPAIVGMNSGDGGLFVASLYNTTSLMYPELRIYFNRLISIISFYNYFTMPERIDAIGEILLNKYFPSGKIDDDSHLFAVKLFTDSVFTQCVYEMMHRLSSPVYSYFYDYQNEFSYNTMYGSCKKPLGVTHGDELTSLFKATALNPTDLNQQDLEVSKSVVNIWYKFIISDNPTIDGSENGTSWPKFTPSNQSMIYLSSNGSICKQNLKTDDYEFWNNLPIDTNI